MKHSSFRKLSSLALVLTLIIACSPSQSKVNSTVIQGATLFDGNGGEAITQSIIVIQDGTITCVGSEGECSTPAGADIINAEGKFITPGLIDAHMHFFQTAFFDSRPGALDVNETYPLSEVMAYQRQNPERYYKSYLCSGITGVYDVGGMSWSIDLQEHAEEADFAPHVAAAGPLITPASNAPFDLPSDKVLVTLTSARAGIQTVQYLSDLGSTGIKFWQFRADDPEYMAMVEAAAEEIKKKGNQMIAHATSLVQAKAALRNGTKLLVHSVEDVEVDEEFIQLALENGTYYNPTLIVGSGYLMALRAAAGIEGYTFDDPNNCTDPKTKQLLEGADQFKDHPRFTDRFMDRLQAYNHEEDRVSDMQLNNLKAVYDAGIPIVVGTDAGNPGTLHGASIYEEMEYMQSAGIPASALIVAATKNGAGSMRRLDDFGTLETGKFGNLILLEEDPSVDISNMRSITHVMVKGKMKKVSEIWE